MRSSRSSGSTSVADQVLIVRFRNAGTQMVLCPAVEICMMTLVQSIINSRSTEHRRRGIGFPSPQNPARTRYECKERYYRVGAYRGGCSRSQSSETTTEEPTGAFRSSGSFLVGSLIRSENLGCIRCTPGVSLSTESEHY